MGTPYTDGGKEPYTESVFHHCDEQARQRAEMRLRKQAARLGCRRTL